MQRYAHEDMDARHAAILYSHHTGLAFATSTSSYRRWSIAPDYLYTVKSALGLAAAAAAVEPCHVLSERVLC